MSLEVAWLGIDDGERLDVVSIDFADEGGFSATGRQSTPTYRAQWDLIVDNTWKTRMLTVDVEGFDPEGSRDHAWQRHLNLWRRDVDASQAGNASSRQSTSLTTAQPSSEPSSLWRCEVGESGQPPADLAPMGMCEQTANDLQAAVDVDLSHCPVTNLMPIRRLGVMKPGQQPIECTMAWVDLRSCSVIASQQFYSSADPGLPEIACALDSRVSTAVHYRSATRGVEVNLSVDELGLVVSYPDLAERLDPNGFELS